MNFLVVEIEFFLKIEYRIEEKLKRKKSSFQSVPRQTLYCHCPVPSTGLLAQGEVPVCIS